MGKGKSIRIGMNRDQVAKAEQAFTIMMQAVDRHIFQLDKNVLKTHEMLELIYDQTPAGMWARFKKWIGGKR